MNRLRYLIMITVLSSIVNNAVSQADGKIKMKLNYNIGMPVGDFKNSYLNKTSYNGAGGEIFYFFNPKVALGLNIGYQSYYQKYPRQTYKTSDNQNISAVLSNTVELMPVMVNGTFTPLSVGSSRVRPYVSAGAGITLVNYRQFYGEFSNGNASTSLAAQAGAGAMFSFGKNRTSSLQLGANYNYASYNNNGLKSLNTLGLQVGIIFPLK